MLAQVEFDWAADTAADHKRERDKKKLKKIAAGLTCQDPYIRSFAEHAMRPVQTGKKQNAGSVAQELFPHYQAPQPSDHVFHF